MLNVTTQQSKVIDFVRTGQGHAVVEALAGTGKTTTIVAALDALPPGARALFVAFNKAIATTLQARVPAGVDAMTLHSLGLRTITRNHGRRPIDGECLKKRLTNFPHFDLKSAVYKIVSRAKATLGEPTPGPECDEFTDQERTLVLRTACDVLDACEADRKGPIDFDDMVWLPAVHGWSVGSYDFVFVDETQDLNAAQLELVKHAIRPGGRIIAIGDRHQSIYAFRGADVDAMPRMIDELSATVFPLSVSFRCPQRVAERAQEFVPNFEAAEHNPTGIVRDASYDELCERAEAGDMVVSRTNAPLVKLCYTWLREGKACYIQGRDIGASLAAWLRKHCAGQSLPEAVNTIRAWAAIEAAKLEAEDKSPEAIFDKADCLVEILGSDSVESAIARCEAMFRDSNNRGVCLTSTHKAKGLEARRVWLMRDTYMRRRKNRAGIVTEPGQEERNLLYVAITRAIEELVYVPSSP